MSILTRFQIDSADFARDPYPAYERLHREDLMYFDPKYGAYLVGKYEDCVQILTSPTFTTRPLTSRAEPVMRGRVLAQMEGDEHGSKRKIVVRGLNGKSHRERFVPLIRQTAERLLEPFLGCGKIDLVNDFGKDFAVGVTLGILGLPLDNSAQVAIWHAAIADFITSLEMDQGRRDRNIECSRLLAEYLRPFVEDRQRQPGDDLISLLCSAEIDGQRMSTSEVIALCLNVLAAATEPADKTLALLFKHLIDHPEQFAAVLDDRVLLADAIDETLRITPPVQLIPRQPSEGVTISGVAIPGDSLVFCLIGAANRDPKVFRDPGRFNLRRNKSGERSLSGMARHLAFGAGTHVCVGAAFSRLQLEVTAGVILDRMRDIRYDSDFDYREAGLYTRGPSSLRLSFIGVRPLSEPKPGSSHSDPALRCPMSRDQ